MPTLPGKSTYQVIHQLPDSASEWQKDSAVQAYFNPGQNNQYSDRIDTLGLPGQRYDRPAPLVVADSLEHPSAYGFKMTAESQPAAHASVMADPVPYAPGRDSLVGSLLIGSFLMVLLTTAVSRKFMGRMTRNLFFVDNQRTTSVPDTTGELTAQGVMVGVTSVLLAITYFCFSLLYQGNRFMLHPHLLLGIYWLVMVAYFLLKILLYQWVGWVFFDVKKIEQWNKSQLFITAIEGMVLLSILLLHVFGPLNAPTMLLAVLIVVFLVKILTFYKCYLIFFQRLGAFLQIFLYFCALEMIPLVGLVGLLETFNEYLEINF